MARPDHPMNSSLHSKHWSAGDAVTLRQVGHRHPTIRNQPGLLVAFPHFVVEDTDDLLALWIPAGTERRFVDLADRSRRVPNDLWRLNTLRLMFPGKAYDIQLYWSADVSKLTTDAPRHDLRAWELGARGEHEFLGWYVNLQAPYVRTPIGFDTTDNSLDVVVDRDYSWRWKDEHLTQHWEDMGVYTREDTESFYAAGREAIALVEQRRFPFDGSYLDWDPPTGWGLPQLAPDWDRVPGYDVTLTTGLRLANLDQRA
jgi:hypothetical protein